MNTVIVPIDFSDISYNAGRYAAKLLQGYEGIEIILYNMYEADVENEMIMEDLQNFKDELLKTTTVNITLYAERGDEFVEELEKFARHRSADLVIMGITGKSAIAQKFIGSNALKMAESKYCPVLIVPGNAEFKEVKNVMLTSDFKDVVRTTPSAPIKKVLQLLNPSLHIVNVNEDIYIEISEQLEVEKEGLEEMFAEFNPEFYFLRLYNVEEAITQFASDKSIDLIITIQKEHSKIYRFFKSHTKDLAYQSALPVLVVHE
jgi:nucleotide-binding universal stress UspA family protein